MQQETQKILGDFAGDALDPLPAKVSAHCNRVPSSTAIWCRSRSSFRRSRPKPTFASAFDKFAERAAGAQAAERAQAAGASTWTEPDRPQPRRDVERERGMARLRRPASPLPGVRLQVHRLAHNTVRGAAGAAVLNAELMPRAAGSTDDRHEVRRHLRRIRRHRTRRLHRRAARQAAAWSSSPRWARPPTSCSPSPMKQWPASESPP